jgi:sortase A
VTATAAATEMPLNRARRPRGRISKTAQVIGELLITFGVIVFLFIFYELKITDWQTAATQHRLSRQLEQQWAPPAATTGVHNGTAKANPGAAALLRVTEGQGFAILQIPRFGSGFHWIVVEGVSHGDLEEGPGHYPGTALPGQLGNVVISGHRTTYGHPFNRLAEMRTGDLVSLQVRSRTYRYRVIRLQIVDPSDTAVILPVPGRFGVTPTQRLLTMTTCNPEYSAAQRLIVTAELTGGGA